MLSFTRLRTRAIWRVPAPPPIVHDLLADVRCYPAWWPDFVDVRPTPAGFAAECRPLPAYPVRLLIGDAAGDRTPGVVEHQIAGDFSGTARWTVLADDDGAGTRVVAEHDLAARAALVVPLGPLAPAALRAGHARMMRRGEAGLRAYAAGYTRALTR